MLTLVPAPPAAPGVPPPFPPPVRIDTAQFAADLDAGRYPAGHKVELSDGVVVLRDTRDDPADPFTHMGHEHIRLVRLARRLLEPLAVAAGGAYWMEHTILLPPHNGPQPDGAILSSPEDAFDHRLAETGDVLMLLEVSLSPLGQDRNTKSRQYAEAGVPVYWLLDAAARRLEVRTDPDPAAGVYRSLATLTATDAASLPLPGGPAPLPLADLLA